MNVIVIEDNDNLRQATVAMLVRNGHWASGLVCAEDLADVQLVPQPDLFVVDLNLPGEDGLSLARRLRAMQPLVGIIMVTARTLLGDRLAGYQSGADIYLPKPVDPSELLAAVESLGRRLRHTPQTVQTVQVEPQADTRARLRLAPAARLLTGPVAEVPLSESEVVILVGLGSAQSGRLEYAEIMTLLGEDPQSYSQAALEVRIVRLRHKLVRSGALTGAISSVRGIGYRLTLPLTVV